VLNRFPELYLEPVAFITGLSSPEKCHNKDPGLSRFSRTHTNIIQGVRVRSEYSQSPFAVLYSGDV